jgi:hypothetical protein
MANSSLPPQPATSNNQAPSGAPPGSVQPQPSAVSGAANAPIPSAGSLTPQAGSQPPSSKEWQDALDTRVKALEKLLTQAKAIITGLVALGIVGAAGAALEGSAKTYWNRIELASQASSRADTAIASGVRLSIRELSNRLFRILERLTGNSPNDALISQLNEGKESTADMLALLKDESRDAPVVRAIQSLHQLYDLVDSYASAIRLPPSAPGTHDRYRRLMSAIKEWQGFDLESLAKADAKLAQEFKPYHRNALGSLRMALAWEDQSQPTYADARADFEEAVRLRPDFAKAHLNLGVIAAREWESSNKQTLTQLDQASAHYRKANEFASTSSMLSLAQANIGDAELKRARWHLIQKHPGDATAAIRTARSNFRRALAQTESQPFAHVGLAAADCLDAALLKPPAGQARRQELIESAMARLQEAVDRGYGGFNKVATDDLKKRFPNLNVCQGADSGFFDRVAKL